MWIKLVLDISELLMPLEDFLTQLQDNGFVIGEHNEEKGELIVFLERQISRRDYFKMNLNMIKGYIKEKLFLFKDLLKPKLIIVKKKITPTFALIKRKMSICMGKIKSGFNKLRGKVSKLFRRGE